MPNLSTKDGTPTGGVFGFATMALEVIKKLKPDYVAVAWDKPKTNIRKRLEIYPEYKAGRKPAPPDFYVQIPFLQELLDAFGWPLYELDDYEADDIMATLATQASKQDIETMLISGDLDMLQVIDAHVHMYATRKGISNIELFHPESFTAKYGISPAQFLDLKALKGDSSDNIPGVPGIGEKTAVELLQKFETLDGVYQNLDKVKDSLRAKLEAGKDSAYMSKKVARLWTNAPIKLNLKEVDGSKFDSHKAAEVLQKLEFRSLVRQLPDGMALPTEHKISTGDYKSYGKVELINTDARLNELKLAGEVIINTRARSKHGRQPALIILSSDPKITYVLHVEKLSKEALSANLSTAKSVVGFDLKNDLKVLIELGATLPKVEHDIGVAAFLINSLTRRQTLNDLARSETDIAFDINDLSDEELIQRAGELTFIIRKIYESQNKQLVSSKLNKVAAGMEWPLIPVLAKMEYLGVKLNTRYLQKFGEELEDAISDVEQKIYGHADQEFNISSPSQLAEVLFTRLNLSKEGIKKGKTGFSTAARELDKLRGLHPIIDLITHYREVVKLKNTYVDTLPKQVDENSRVHTTYDLDVAPTGRLSSHDPNLQNIPTKTDLGRRIKTAFEPDKGNVFISADYSQFELRLAAVLADDKNMIELFNKDEDIHAATAAQVYGRELEDVTKQMRSSAKAVNFGIMYGLSPHGLAQGTGMTHEQAKSFIDKYFELRPNLLSYIEKVREQALKQGFVETMFGRRRPTPDVHSSNFMVREAAMRAAVNMPFQGSASDIMKMAMIGLDKKLEGTSCKILLQIHDSLILECPEGEAKKYSRLVKETMESVVKLPVKLTVDTSIGKNWGEL